MTINFSLIERLLLLLLATNLATAAEFESEYVQGDVISPAVFVSDKEGGQVSVASLLKAADAGVNVLYIFGGGDMGSGQPGHLWCQDSFEDTHILRTLYSKYQERGVNFIAVAVSPAYHSQMLGHPAGVFLTDAATTENFQAATQDFVTSTLAAYDSGILPVEPFFDTRFRLLFNRSEDLRPRAEYGEVFPWQGAFRAPDETQFYGVPGLWLLDNEGRVLTAPFRGNIYHPHGAEVTISYTFGDVDNALGKLL